MHGNETPLCLNIWLSVTWQIHYLREFLIFMTRSSEDVRALIRSWSVFLIVQTTCCLPATRMSIHYLSHLQFAQWRAGLIAFEWLMWTGRYVCVRERQRELLRKLSIAVFDLSWQLAMMWQFWLGATWTLVYLNTPNTRSCPLILAYKRSQCNAKVVGYTCKYMQIYNGSLILTNLSTQLLLYYVKYRQYYEMISYIKKIGERMLISTAITPVFSVRFLLYLRHFLYEEM